MFVAILTSFGIENSSQHRGQPRKLLALISLSKFFLFITPVFQHEASLVIIIMPWLSQQEFSLGTPTPEEAILTLHWPLLDNNQSNDHDETKQADSHDVGNDDSSVAVHTQEVTECLYTTRTGSCKYKV